MEFLSSKEFFEQLNTNMLKPSFVLLGTVMKSENDSEVLFARKGEFGNWVKIPSSMVDLAQVLKSFTKDGETYTVVKLKLKSPTTPEGKVLQELLAKGHEDDRHEHVSSWKHKIMGLFGHCKMCGCAFGKREGLMGHHCKCACHHMHHDEVENGHENVEKK